MTITLKHLSVHGPGLLPAVVVFDGRRTLIRGPSDTGKSHIWKCIWFLLGGTATLEQFPESQGYDSLELAFLHGEHEYLVRKAMSGGAARVLVRLDDLWVPDGTPNPLEDVNQDLGELLVQLSGAAGKQVLRKRSEKGPITGDDLRHWALLSQPGMISEDATKGKRSNRPARAANRSEETRGVGLLNMARWNAAPAKTEVAMVQIARGLACVTDRRNGAGDVRRNGASF